VVHVPQYVAGGRRELTGIQASVVIAAYRLASRLAPLLPRAAAYPLCDRLGDQFWRFNRPARRAVRDNLRHVLGHSPPEYLVRQVFRHGARNYYDTFIIPTLGSQALLDLVAVQGWEHLDKALAAGGGAIMVAAHLSSVALAGQVVAARGHALTSVVEHVEPPELMGLLTRLRSGGGVRVLPLGPDLTRELLAVLRRNEVVGLIMDRDIVGTGVTVEFFGSETRLPGGAALLALRTGAPILPAVTVRRADDRFEGRVGPPIAVERGADLRDSIRLTTRRIAERFEQDIAAQPDQWTVYQPVWPSPSGGGGERSA
jgi:lauroyl/myristoyl acyltransferase